MPFDNGRIIRIRVVHYCRAQNNRPVLILFNIWMSKFQFGRTNLPNGDVKDDEPQILILNFATCRLVMKKCQLLRR